VKAKNVATKLIESHLVSGTLEVGTEIGIRIDQTLTQDATGTLVMLELESMGLDRVQTEVSAQYVDHNLLQADFKNADDHLFLRSACRRFGVWYSRPGNGVSHPLHQERFGRPGKTLLGADSHTCAAGAIGMLAFGAGGLEVALAMAGEPFYFNMPAIWGVRLENALAEWVSAKDIILEMLRRHGVRGGIGRIVEYHGPGVALLSAMDRHVIANMGAELGATASVFQADGRTLEFLRGQGREADFVPVVADDDAEYDVHDTIDLAALEPLVALPSSPGCSRSRVRSTRSRGSHRAGSASTSPELELAGLIGVVVISVFMLIASLVTGQDIWPGMKMAGTPFLGERAMQPGFDLGAVAVPRLPERAAEVDGGFSAFHSEV
jgi:aconitate hydratase